VTKKPNGPDARFGRAAESTETKTISRLAQDRERFSKQPKKKEDRPKTRTRKKSNWDLGETEGGVRGEGQGG